MSFWLDTKEIMPKCVVKAISGAKERGKSMYDKYVEERLNKRSKLITALENSLKQGNREARGTGTCRRVCDNAAIPLNWKSFLRFSPSDYPI